MTAAPMPIKSRSEKLAFAKKIVSNKHLFAAHRKRNHKFFECVPICSIEAEGFSLTCSNRFG